MKKIAAAVPSFYFEKMYRLEIPSGEDSKMQSIVRHLSWAAKEGH